MKKGISFSMVVIGVGLLVLGISDYAPAGSGILRAGRKAAGTR